MHDPKLLVEIEELWIVTPSSVEVGYQQFGGPGCLHLHRLENLKISHFIYEIHNFIM
jgi:hypothetical protein